MHFSPRFYESLATCILFFPLKCIILSLQIIIIEMIELLIFTEFICCCYVIGKWSRISLYCKTFVVLSFFSIVNDLFSKR
jgi:hypothetical protein